MDSYIGGYERYSAHRGMLADSNRVKGYKEAIYKHCKDKVVIDLGAGSGILGLLAHLAGAKQVYFVELDKRIHTLIMDNAKLNGIQDVHIFERYEDISEDVSFDVCVSEPLSNNAIEEFLVDYNKLIMRNPGCIAIPDEVVFFHKIIASQKIEGFNKNIINCGIKLIEPMKIISDPSQVKIYGHKKSNSKKIISIDLKKTLPKTMKVEVKPPVIEDANGAILWWQANCQGEYVTSNSPELVDNNCNHWYQTLLPSSTAYELKLYFYEQKVTVKFNGTSNEYNLRD